MAEQGSTKMTGGIALALHDEGARVVAVARDPSRTTGLITEAGDATEPAVAERLLDRHRPGVLVIAAGAVPPTRPLHEHTFQTFRGLGAGRAHRVHLAPRGPAPAAHTGAVVVVLAAPPR
jgi:hypothetical protein